MSTRRSTSRRITSRKRASRSRGAAAATASPAPPISPTAARSGRINRARCPRRPAPSAACGRARAPTSTPSAPTTAGANVFHSSDHGATWTSQLAGGAIDLQRRRRHVVERRLPRRRQRHDPARQRHAPGARRRTRPPPATRLLAVLAIAPMDIYVAGGGNTIMHSRRGGGWVTQTVVGTTELRGIWGVAGHIWAVGSGGTILEVDRQRHVERRDQRHAQRAARDLRHQRHRRLGRRRRRRAALRRRRHLDRRRRRRPHRREPARASAAAPADRCWAVGNAWTIVRRDASAAWVVEPTGLAVDDPAGDVLQAIFAPSTADVFAGGAGRDHPASSLPRQRRRDSCIAGDTARRASARPVAAPPRHARVLKRRRNLVEETRHENHDLAFAPLSPPPSPA